MNTQTDALRIAEILELTCEPNSMNEDAAAELRRLSAANAGLESEVLEQARIIGMGAERELSAMARITELTAANAELLEALEAIALYIPTTSAAEGGASKYSNHVKAADTVRAAIAKHKGTTT